MSTRFVSYLISGALLGLLACSQQQQTDKAEATSRLPVTVGTIEQSVRDIGGKETVVKYLCAQDPSTEDFTALNNISAGSKEWVDMAIKMLPYSDAGCSGSLHSSLGDAMQKQPKNVLPYVGQSEQLSPDRICMPFISNELPNAEALREVQRSKAAIESVTDPELTQPCAACLQETVALEKKILADMAQEGKK